MRPRDGTVAAGARAERVISILLRDGMRAYRRTGKCAIDPSETAPAMCPVALSRMGRCGAGNSEMG